MVAVNGVQPRTTSQPPPPPQPLIAPTGIAKLDAVADVVNNVAAPFQSAPPPEQGTLGAISHGVNAVMGVVGAPFEMLDVGFAMATASIAALMPGLPAATLTAPHLGLPHGHSHPPSLIPPAPPVPLPSIGTLAAAGCVSVLIGGIPAGRAGDLGPAPTCGSLAPMFEVYTGSSNTFIGGSRAARMTDITRHCNPASVVGSFGKAMGAVGVVAGALGAGAQAAGGNAAAAAMQAAQAAADAIALAMSLFMGKDPGLPPSMGALMLGNPTVLIGGFPMPDVLDVLGGLAGAAKKAGGAIKKLGSKPAKKPAATKPQKCNDPSEPIAIVTGEVYNTFSDVIIDPSEGWVWRRHYRSSWSEQAGPMGRGFRHSFEKSLVFHRRRAVFTDFDGVEIEFLRKTDAAPYQGIAFGYRLEQLGERDFRLTTPHGASYRFSRTTEASRGRLVEVRGVTHAPIGLQYDAKGRLDVLWMQTRSNRRQIKLQYGAQGCVVSVDAGAGVSLARYAYDEQQCLREHQNPRGARASYTYDAHHRMIRAEDAKRYGFNWTYDHKGRCVASRGDDDLLGVRVAYEVGKTIVTQADGGVWEYIHNDDGLLTAILDPCGGVKRYKTNDAGMIAEQVEPTGEVYAWLYDATGHNDARVDRWGNLVGPENDDPFPGNGRELVVPTSVRQAICGREEPPPSPRSDLDRVSVPEPLRAEMLAVLHLASRPRGAARREYDSAGSCTGYWDEEGRVTRCRFSPMGEPVEIVDPDGRTTKQVFSSWNLIVATSDPLGITTRYGYDHRRLITSITDGRGHTVKYERDLAGRVLRVLNGDALEERYERDAAGRVVTTFDSRDETLVRYEYGPHGLCSTRTQATGEVHQYDYDAWGNIKEASSADFEVHLTFDEQRRVLGDTRDGKGIVHELRGKTRRRIDVLGTLSLEVEYEPGGVTIVMPGGGHHVYRRYPGGCVERQHAGGLRELSHFDTTGACTGRYVWADRQDSQALWYARYHYSRAGELRKIEDRFRGETTLEYDAAHRLLGWKRANGKQVAFRYDAAGNLVSTATHAWLSMNARNQLVSAPGESFEYNHRDHLCEHRNGTHVTRYVYNGADQLVRVVWSDGRPDWTAAYDGLGRRVYKAQGEARTEFYWDGDRLAAEVGPKGHVRVYVYPTADALLPFLFVDYEREGAPATSGRVYVPIYDQVGLPSHVYDTDGRVVWLANDVDPYGSLTADPRSQIRFDLRFPGHYYDEETRLHYNRFRYYAPAWGRYLQSDPMGQAGGLNVYAYPSNPVCRFDAFGLHDDDGTTPPKSTTGSGSSDKSPPDAELRDATKAKADALRPLPSKERPNIVAGMKTPDGQVTTAGSYKGPRDEFDGLDGAPKTKDAYDKAAAEVQKPADWDESVHGPWPQSHQSGKCGEAQNIANHEREHGTLPPEGTVHDAAQVRGQNSTSGHGDPKPACPYCSHVQDQLGHSSQSGQSPYATNTGDGS